MRVRGGVEEELAAIGFTPRAISANNLQPAPPSSPLSLSSARLPSQDAHWRFRRLSSPPPVARCAGASPRRRVPALRLVDYGHNPRGAKVESPRVSRIGALLQGLGCAPGTSRFLPSFGSEQDSSSAPGRRSRRTQSTRSRMPVMRGLLAPQNTFLDTIATRFDGTRE